MNRKHTNSDHVPPNTSQLQDLYEAIASIENPAEAAAFLRDLLTIAELTEFANRWQIVLMLDNGKPYAHIAKELGVSTTTVTRVAHWLNHGTGGYRKALERMKK